MKTKFSRREAITRSGACLATVAASTASVALASADDSDSEPFGYCLNSGTIRGQRLNLDQEIDVVARAGYRGIEPWVSSIEQYQKQTGSLKDLRTRLDDSGVSVESAIGFARWSVDDDQQRAEGVEQVKVAMDLIAQLGGTRIAAPPAGINRTAGVDLLKVAERYRVILELGREMGVVPQLEIWGPSLTLSRVGEAALVAAEAAHPDACLLLDAYHMYRGGSSFESLKLLNGAAMHVFHINDYPAHPPREELTDADRVYPGDGAAPMSMILRTLYDTGFRGMLSLELFNRDYWAQDALVVARTGLEKMKAAVAKAMA